MTAKSDLLREVIETNRALLRRARELNLRAGEPVFPAQSRAELEAWVASRLCGARSAAEIADAEGLRLPPLDEELAALVVRENPEEMELLGEERKVEYREGQPPRVSVRCDAADFSWQALPDEGVRLPGGRAVEVAISFGWHATFADCDIPTLKGKVREHLNLGQWDTWPRPDLPMPDVTAAGAVIPEITTAEYGTCVVTGEPLLAYGAIATRGYRYSFSDSWFEGKWYRDRDEAEAARALSVRKFEEIRAEERQKRELETARAEAEAVKAQLRSLYGRCPYDGAERSLYRRLGEQQYSSSFLTVAQVRQWIDLAKTLIAEAEPFIAEAERRREVEERERVELEAAKREAEAKAHAEAFPRAVLGCAKSNIQRAIRILESELNAPYGRSRRQQAVQRNLPGLEATAAGQKFLAHCRASDVDEDLDGAIAWLHNQAAPKIRAAAEESASAVAEEKTPESSIDALRKAWGAR